MIPNVSYTFLINGVQQTTNSGRVSFVAPYNAVTIKFTSDCSLSYWEARITPNDSATIDDYDIGVGTCASWGSNLSANTLYSKVIDVNSTNFSQGDGTYRISLYSKSELDGLWDVTYLLFTVEGYKVVPTTNDGVEMLTKATQPQ